MSIREKIGVDQGCWEVVVFLSFLAAAISLVVVSISVPYAWYQVRKIEIMADQGYEEAPMVPGAPNGGTYLRKVHKP